MNRMGKPIRFLLAMVASLAIGCVSSYQPHEPGRIHFVLAKGTRMLERDGRLYGISGLSIDPIEMVAGDPVAETHARTFVKRRQTSLWVMLLGAAVMVPGGFLNTTDPGHLGQKIVARGMIGAAGATVLGALLVYALAPTHLYDAVNIYNDGVARSRPEESPSSGSGPLPPVGGVPTVRASKNDGD